MVTSDNRIDPSSLKDNNPRPIPTFGFSVALSFRTLVDRRKWRFLYTFSEERSGPHLRSDTHRLKVPWPLTFPLTNERREDLKGGQGKETHGHKRQYTSYLCPDNYFTTNESGRKLPGYPNSRLPPSFFLRTKWFVQNTITGLVSVEVARSLWELGPQEPEGNFLRGKKEQSTKSLKVHLG